MSLGDSLSAEISRALGRPFRAASAGEAGGGCIHRALVLEGGGERWFVKLNSAQPLPMFEAEQDGLAALAAPNAVRVPRPLCSGIVEGQACLVLEHLDLRPIAERGDAVACGHALAALHRATGARYGWHRDNFIGATPQLNAGQDSWARFFADARLRPQRCAERRRPSSIRPCTTAIARRTWR